MKKIVITGFSGFVASHFVEYLYNSNNIMEVYGLCRKEPTYDYSKLKKKIPIKTIHIDLMDVTTLRMIISQIKPDYLLHLAAYSSVAYSWAFPEDSFTNNCNIFLNVIDAVRQFCPSCRILSVGSSEEYGNVSEEKLPLKETQTLNPISPYAVARVSQELLSKVYVNAYGMQIIMTRSFNHIGPRQDSRFVIPSFIKRIIDVHNAGYSRGTIVVGDLSIIRDFVDVRDVVEAYYLLLTRGRSGEVYNVCSGQGISLADVVNIISNEVGVVIDSIKDDELIRPNDNMQIVGSPKKLESELGWQRNKRFIDTIRDMIKYYD